MPSLRVTVRAGEAARVDKAARQELVERQNVSVAARFLLLEHPLVQRRAVAVFKAAFAQRLLVKPRAVGLRVRHDKLVPERACQVLNSVRIHRPVVQRNIRNARLLAAVVRQFLSIGHWAPCSLQASQAQALRLVIFSSFLLLFSSDLAHLRIHPSLVARFGTMDKTIVTSHHMRLCYISAKFGCTPLSHLSRGANGMRCKIQQRTNVARGTHGLFQRSEPGYRKTQLRTNVARGSYGFHSSLDTGLPEIYVSVAASMRLRKVFDEFAGLIDDARV